MTKDEALRLAREALKDFADFGFRADCNPTMEWGKGEWDLGMRFYSYLRSVDTSVRERAKRALAAIDASLDTPPSQTPSATDAERGR